MFLLHWFPYTRDESVYAGGCRTVRVVDVRIRCRVLVVDLPFCYMTLSSKARLLQNAFKDANAATFLAAASSPDSIPRLNGLPEVIVAGRANVGKSTFLNAIMGRANLVNASKKAGRTRALNFFRVGREPGSLVLVDSPGYGARGRTDWGRLWDCYIDNRKELRGIFILINAPHGVTDYDRAMLEDVSARLSARASASSEDEAAHVPVLQPIFTKLDRLKDGEEAQKQLHQEVKKLAPNAASPILAAVNPSLDLNFGVMAARLAISMACAEW